MRQGLIHIHDIGNRSGRFFAKVEAILPDGRILCCDLRDKYHKMVSSHFWTGTRYWFSSVDPVVGLEFTFIASIRTYHRRDGSKDLKPIDLREIRAV